MADTCGINLIDSAGRRTTVSEDRREAVLSFGGIFEFNTVCARLAAPGEYQLYVFDGTSFYHRVSGKSEGNEIFIRLNKMECGSYQIKLVASSPFATAPEFKVSKEK